MIFNNAFVELNHDNNKKRQTEVHNDDADDTVNVKQPSKASRNFTKPVSYKDITEAIQKAVQSIEDTKRQHRKVLRKSFSLPESMGSKKQTWGLSDLKPKLIANQI